MLAFEILITDAFHVQSYGNENKRTCRDNMIDHLFSCELATNAAAKLVAHIFLPRAHPYGKEKKGTKERKRKRMGEGSTRVIPTNFREIALTSFSRGHIAIATAARPPRVHFTADSATNFTDAATNIAIGNSF